jgi:Tfp pilus assembly protein PilO
VMILQAVPPVPPMPPEIPFDPNFVLSRLDSPAVVMIVLAALIAATIVLWPLARALARRLEGKSAAADPGLRHDLEQVTQRLTEVDGLQARVAELEERLDFAERLLAQSREPGRLQS